MIELTQEQMEEFKTAMENLPHFLSIQSIPTYLNLDGYIENYTDSTETPLVTDTKLPSNQ